jgi:starvation-inducible DNA-binding protein
MSFTHNTLKENVRVRSASLLNRHLAAAIDLHAQVKQERWNVRGPGFFAIHELFDRIACEVEDYSDLLAERAQTLGFAALGTIQRAAPNSFLVNYPLEIADTREHLFAVAGALAAFEQSARDEIDATASFGDPETADVFTEIGRGLSKQLWFVESHLAAH